MNNPADLNDTLEPREASCYEKPEVRPEKCLVYTVAVDPAGTNLHAQMAKLLACSLLRTLFTGDIVIFRNTPEALFPVGRPGLLEVELPTPDYAGYKDEQEAWRYKFRVRESLATLGLHNYDKVIFLDADSLALRNVDHLFPGDWDIGHQLEIPGRSITLKQFHCFLTEKEMASLGGRPGSNSGTLAVRSEHFLDVMEEWERIDLGPTERERHCSDQASWNRLLLDTKLKKHAFEKGEVQFPLFIHPKYHDWKECALIHSLGGTVQEKLRFNFGVYMQTFFWDPAGTVLRLLEA